jgi:hypothetical protein
VERLELSTNGLKERKNVFAHHSQETTVFDPVRWTQKNKVRWNSYYFRSTVLSGLSTLTSRVYQISWPLEIRRCGLPIAPSGGIRPTRMAGGFFYSAITAGDRERNQFLSDVHSGKGGRNVPIPARRGSSQDFREPARGIGHPMNYAAGLQCGR